MGDHLLCCFYYNRQSGGSRHNSSAKFPLRSVDKSMIGLPTNFQHCQHIGCSDLAPGSGDVSPQINVNINGNISDDSNSQHNQFHGNPPILSHMKLIDLKTC